MLKRPTIFLFTVGACLVGLSVSANAATHGSDDNDGSSAIQSVPVVDLSTSSSDTSTADESTQLSVPVTSVRRAASPSNASDTGKSNASPNSAAAQSGTSGSTSQQQTSSADGAISTLDILKLSPKASTTTTAKPATTTTTAKPKAAAPTGSPTAAGKKPTMPAGQAGKPTAPAAKPTAPPTSQGSLAMTGVNTGLFAGIGMILTAIGIALLSLRQEITNALLPLFNTSPRR